MANPATIARVDFGDDPNSFVSLKRTGIGYVQQLCGSVWTDYNSHDPGVTILEQLCYGLTDLNYQANCSVADLLTDSNNQLSLNKLALQEPQRILPARPTTLSDYHHVILGKVTEVEQLWIYPYRQEYSQRACGLYQIDLRLTHRAYREREQQGHGFDKKLIKKVADIYHQNRNLAEDLFAITIIEQAAYRLSADIEIQPQSDGSRVLAEVYFQSRQFLTGAIEVESFEQQLNQGIHVDKVLEGPLVLSGNFVEQSIDNNAQFGASSKEQNKSLSALQSHLLAVEGIERISSLSLINVADGNAVDASSPTIDGLARLHIPAEPDEIEVNIRRNGQLITIPFGIVKNRFSQLEFKQESMRHARQDLSLLFPAPTGTYQQFEQYYSIQNHFPATYKLNEIGLSANADLERAQIRQLRGYLVLFEQFMANFGANLQHIHRLFSLDWDGGKSYHFHLLDNKTITGIDHIYPESPEIQFEQLMEEFDDYFDRKGRVFDYLLALYGEELEQSIISEFNYYDEHQQLQQRLLRNKRDFLKDIVTLGKDRGSGFNLHKIGLTKSNISGLQARLNYFLGFTEASHWPYGKQITSQGVKVVDDKRFFSPFNEADWDLRAYNNREICHVPTLASSKEGDKDSQTLNSQSLYSGSVFNQFKLLTKGDISSTMLSAGSQIKNYRVVELLGCIGFELQLKVPCAEVESAEVDELLKANGHLSIYNTDQNRGWLRLCADLNKESLFEKANQLQQLLKALNQQTEGLYVVEHLLLRPDNWPDHSPHKEQEPEDGFYPFQVSIILPGFTARCQDPGFRIEAQNIIEQNCPAHILPHCLWLEADELLEFERLYIPWLTFLVKNDNEQRSLEYEQYAAAAKLAAWLKGIIDG